MLICQKLEQLSIQYDDARKIISIFLLEQRLQIKKLSMQDIADATFTSKATLVRVAKQLGYSGWSSFFRDYVDELENQQRNFGNSDHNFPFQAHESTQEIMDHICQLRMESLWQTARIQDLSQIHSAVQILKKAKRIALLGTSTNHILLELFQKKMLTIGKMAELMPPSESGFHVKSLTPDDCAIMVSYSGDNKNALPMANLESLVDRNIPVIGITSMGENYLRKHTNCTLTIFSQERLYSKISNYSTESSIVYLLDVLFSCYFASDYDRNLTYKISNSRDLEIKRQTSNSALMENQL